MLFLLLIQLISLISTDSSSDVGHFWHVSDFHLDPRYGVNASQDQDIRDIFLGQYDEGCWTEKRNSLGDYNCDSPFALVKVTFDA